MKHKDLSTSLFFYLLHKSWNLNRPGMVPSYPNHQKLVLIWQWQIWPDCLFILYICLCLLKFFFIFFYLRLNYGNLYYNSFLFYNWSNFYLVLSCFPLIYFFWPSFLSFQLLLIFAWPYLLLWWWWQSHKSLQDSYH